MTKAIRKSNIEVLRIVLMLMIILNHLIYYGLGVKNIETGSFQFDNSGYIKVIVDCFLVNAVNTFVFISGYFGITFKLRTVISYVSQALFYSIILFLVFSYFGHHSLCLSNFFYSFIPISRPVWWFISIYLGLYFIAPYLNKGVETMDKDVLTITLGGLLFFNCFSGFFFKTFSERGYSIFNFMVIYLIARYIKKYRIRLKVPLFHYFFLTLLIVIGVLTLVHFNKSSQIFKLFSYNNPLLIASAIMLFFVFYEIEIKYNKLINLIATQVLGVYMIHDYPSLRNVIANYIKGLENCFRDTPWLIVFSVVLTAFCILLVAAAVEGIRKFFFEKILDWLISVLKSNRSIVVFRKKLLASNQ